MQEGKKMPVKAGDQTDSAETKKNYPKSQIDQGEACCDAGHFEALTGQSGAMRMDPKVKGQPSKGPFDAPSGKTNAGKGQSMPEAKEKDLKPLKTRPARNSKNK